MLEDYANTTGWNFLKKNEKMGFGPTSIPLNFESDLDHHLNTKKMGFSFFSDY